VEIALVSGNPHLPQLVGGVEVNTHELAGELLRRGHRVQVVAKLSMRNLFGLRRAACGILRGNGVLVDCDLGYPVYRSRRPAQPPSELRAPAVAVIQNGDMLRIAEGFAGAGIASIAYLHGLGFETWRGAGAIAETLPFRGYIANSHFTAGRFRTAFGIDPVVIPPLFRRENYVTEVDDRLVTFINPVAEKGVDLALAIARLCPEIPFCFVRGWPLGVRAGARLQRQLRRLGNVTLCGPFGDMRSIYRQTRMLLVPSQWEAETWGRVVTEAQFSGIPVVASDRGGLPEAVGAGGILLAHDAAAGIWAAAVRDLWRDDERHRAMSQAALAHAARPAIDPDYQLPLLLEALERFSG
jgi:glycosyltransferase involved in cell wall biosynthesis